MMRALQSDVHVLALRNGFWERPTAASDDHQLELLQLGAKLALVHSEVSEALEELREPEVDLDAVGEELADAVIRIMDVCERLGIDLELAIEAKHSRNQLRPYRHGKNF